MPCLDDGIIFPKSLNCQFSITWTHSAAPSLAFEGGVEKRGSGSTLSKPWPSGQGVEGLTFLRSVTIIE